MGVMYCTPLRPRIPFQRTKVPLINSIGYHLLFVLCVRINHHHQAAPSTTYGTETPPVVGHTAHSHSLIILIIIVPIIRLVKLVVYGRSVVEKSSWRLGVSLLSAPKCSSGFVLCASVEVYHKSTRVDYKDTQLNFVGINGVCLPVPRISTSYYCRLNCK